MSYTCPPEDSNSTHVPPPPLHVPLFFIFCLFPVCGQKRATDRPQTYMEQKKKSAKLHDCDVTMAPSVTNILTLLPEMLLRIMKFLVADAEIGPAIQACSQLYHVCNGDRFLKEHDALARQRQFPFPVRDDDVYIPCHMARGWAPLGSTVCVPRAVSRHRHGTSLTSRLFDLRSDAMNTVRCLNFASGHCGALGAAETLSQMYWDNSESRPLECWIQYMCDRIPSTVYLRDAYTSWTRYSLFGRLFARTEAIIVNVDGEDGLYESPTPNVEFPSTLKKFVLSGRSSYSRSWVSSLAPLTMLEDLQITIPTRSDVFAMIREVMTTNSSTLRNLHVCIDNVYSFRAPAGVSDAETLLVALDTMELTFRHGMRVAAIVFSVEGILRLAPNITRLKLNANVDATGIHTRLSTQLRSMPRLRTLIADHGGNVVEFEIPIDMGQPMETGDLFDMCDAFETMCGRPPAPRQIALMSKISKSVREVTGGTQIRAFIGVCPLEGATATLFFTGAYFAERLQDLEVRYVSNFVDTLHVIIPDIYGSAMDSPNFDTMFVPDNVPMNLTRTVLFLVDHGGFATAYLQFPEEPT